MQTVQLGHHPLDSIDFGMSNYCVAIAAKSAHIVWIEQPTAADVLGLWLSGEERPTSSAHALTSQLLQTCQSTSNVKVF
jgi:hypothetical protein